MQIAWVAPRYPVPRTVRRGLVGREVGSVISSPWLVWCGYSSEGPVGSVSKRAGAEVGLALRCVRAGAGALGAVDVAEALPGAGHGVVAGHDVGAGWPGRDAVAGTVDDAVVGPEDVEVAPAVEDLVGLEAVLG